MYAPLLNVLDTAFCNSRSYIESISPTRGWPEYTWKGLICAIDVKGHLLTIYTFFCHAHNYLSFGLQRLRQLVMYWVKYWTLTPLLPCSESPSHLICPNKVLIFTNLLARRLIFLKLTHSSPPIQNKWIHEILHCIRLERIGFSLRGSL